MVSEYDIVMSWLKSIGKYLKKFFEKLDKDWEKR